MAGMGTARIVLPLFMGVAVAGAHMFLVSPLLPDIADEFARSTSEIGRAASAGSLGTAVTAALAVPVMDRFPRKLILIGALLALALALGLVAAAPTYATFTVAFALAGASIGVLLPTTYAMAADLTSAADRSRVLGLVLLGWSASYLIQPLVSKLGDTTGWRGAYGAVAAVALLAALLVAAALTGCGGGKDPADAAEILGKTFSNKKPINSGRLSLAIDVRGASVAGLPSPFKLDLGGPFATNPGGRVPKFQFDLTLGTGADKLTIGAISTGAHGWVQIGGKAFTLPDSTFSGLAKGRPSTSSEPSGLKLSDLGVDPRRWLKLGV